MTSSFSLVDTIFPGKSKGANNSKKKSEKEKENNDFSAMDEILKREMKSVNQYDSDNSSELNNSQKMDESDDDECISTSYVFEDSSKDNASIFIIGGKKRKRKKNKESDEECADLSLKKSGEFEKNENTKKSDAKMSKVEILFDEHDELTKDLIENSILNNSDDSNKNYKLFFEYIKFKTYLQSQSQSQSQQ